MGEPLRWTSDEDAGEPVAGASDSGAPLAGTAEPAPVPSTSGAAWLAEPGAALRVRRGTPVGETGGAPSVAPGVVWLADPSAAERARRGPAPVASAAPEAPETSP